jgi:DNA/RNA-binding domain of Phe-tRNA-synthetase-like protein
MHFSHHPALRAAYPELACGVLFAQGLHTGVDASAPVERFEQRARARLAGVASESDLPEIQAWRRAFQRMGLKPTQYRCASESLLRRLRKDGGMPRIHPFIDLCNALSMAFAIPVAALDAQRVEGSLQVRQATGAERYLSFSGEIEHPEPGEVTFADDAGNAHARRWTHRQSGLSAVRDATRSVLVVCEAMHPDGEQDVAALVQALAAAVAEVWGVGTHTALLSAAEPAFRLPAG